MAICNVILKKKKCFFPQKFIKKNIETHIICGRGGGMYKDSHCSKVWGWYNLKKIF